MKLEPTTDRPAPLWNPIATLALLAMAVGGIVMLMSCFEVSAAAKGQAIIGGLTTFAAAAMVSGCALIALGAALPRRRGRVGAALFVLLVGPGLCGVAGAFASARWLEAVGEGDRQLAGVLGLLASAFLCGCTLIALALHYGRR